MSNRRTQILELNHDIRRGNGKRPTRLPDGEVEFRIPEEDFPVLCQMYPALLSEDQDEAMQEWNKLRHSPIGEKYLVTRTPNQVKRSGNSRIIVR